MKLKDDVIREENSAMETDEYLHFLSYLERINNNENQLISEISVALKYYGVTPEVTPLLDDLCQMHEGRNFDKQFHEANRPFQFWFWFWF